MQEYHSLHLQCMASIARRRRTSRELDQDTKNAAAATASARAGTASSARTGPRPQERSFVAPRPLPVPLRAGSKGDARRQQRPPRRRGGPRRQAVRAARGAPGPCQAVLEHHQGTVAWQRRRPADTLPPGPQPGQHLAPPTPPPLTPSAGVHRQLRAGVRVRIHRPGAAAAAAGAAAAGALAGAAAGDARSRAKRWPGQARPAASSPAGGDARRPPGAPRAADGGLPVGHAHAVAQVHQPLGGRWGPGPRCGTSRPTRPSPNQPRCGPPDARTHARTHARTPPTPAPDSRAALPAAPQPTRSPRRGSRKWGGFVSMLVNGYFEQGMVG
jgi:hypothetical protein